METQNTITIKILAGGRELDIVEVSQLQPGPGLDTLLTAVRGIDSLTYAFSVDVVYDLAARLRFSMTLLRGMQQLRARGLFPKGTQKGLQSLARIAQ